MAGGNLGPSARLFSGTPAKKLNNISVQVFLNLFAQPTMVLSSASLEIWTWVNTGLKRKNH